MEGTRTRKDRRIYGGSLTSYESFDIVAVGPPSTKYIVSETLRRMSTTINTSQTHHNGDQQAEIEQLEQISQFRC